MCIRDRKRKLRLRKACYLPEVTLLLSGGPQVRTQGCLAQGARAGRSRLFSECSGISFSDHISSSRFPVGPRLRGGDWVPGALYPSLQKRLCRLWRPWDLVPSPALPPPRCVTSAEPCTSLILNSHNHRRRLTAAPTRAGCWEECAESSFTEMTRGPAHSRGPSPRTTLVLR